MLRQQSPTEDDASAKPPKTHRQPFTSLLSLSAVALLTGLLVIDALTHSKPLILPILSAALTVGGFAWAAVAALRHRERPLEERETGPALVVFLGFAAAMLSDADQLATYLQLK
jgi:hypothetical protein